MSAVLALALVAAPQLSEPLAVPEPVQVHVQLGSVVRVQLDAAITRLSVANSTVAVVEREGPYTARVRGNGIGRTIAVVWSDSGRQTLVIYVEAMPAEPAAEPVDKRFWTLAPAGDKSLHVYRGTVYGTATSMNTVVYGGQRHEVSSTVPALAGSAGGAATMSVPAQDQGETRLDYVQLRYDDPVLRAELGDVSTGTLTTLGVPPQVRGVLASYNDRKYLLTVFGGILPDFSRGVYSVEGPPQYGVQSQFFAAENLTFTLQATQVQRPVSGVVASQTTVTPAVRWLPLSNMSVDVESAVHDEGAAARLRLGYDAPLLSAHTLYQLTGPSYLYPGTPRADLAQVSLILTPSAYYNLMALGGRSTLGAEVWAGEPPVDSTFAETSLRIFPRPGTSTQLEMRYGISDGHTLATLGSAESSHSRQTARVAWQSGTAWANSSYRVEIVADDTIDDARAAGANRQRRRALGSQAAFSKGLFANRVALAYQLAYERRHYRVGGPFRRTLQETDYVAASQGLTVKFGPVYNQVDLFLANERAGAQASTSWGGRVVLALKPTQAHDLRAQVQFFANPVDALNGESLAVPDFYTGSLTYAYAFGAGIDAPGLLDLFSASGVDVLVFVDSNENGALDAGENGLPDVAVVADGGERLYTDKSGRLRFGGLAQGEHVVDVDAASIGGMRFTTASTRRVWLGKNQDVDVQLGVSDRSQLYALVFNDANLDGAYQHGEPGLSDVALSVGTLEQKLAQGVTTGGVHVFRGLGPGEYIVGVDPRTFPRDYVWGDANGNGHPEGAWFTGKSGGENGPAAGSPSVRLKVVHAHLAGGELVVLRIPLRAVRSVAGRVYIDRDLDRQFGARDRAAMGVTVRLGTTTKVTDAEGRYLFRDVPAGAMALSVDVATLPVGAELVSSPQLELRVRNEPVSEEVDFVMALSR